MKTCRLAIVQHFLAHYRRPIYSLLAKQADLHVEFFADLNNPMMPGVPTWVPTQEFKVHRARCRSLPGGFIWQQELLRLAFRRDIDAIIYMGNYRYLSTWISACIARITGKKVLFWTIGWLGPDKVLSGWLRGMFYRLAHGLLLYGNWARERGIRAGMRPERLYVVYNSLDWDSQSVIRSRIDRHQLSKVREELFDNPNHPLIICVSRLVHERRLDLLLAALARLRELHHEVNLLLVGSGPEESVLRELAQRTDLPVYFLGACYDEERLAWLISSATVAVVPARSGLLSMHCMTYGCPVITHNDQLTQSPEAEAIIAGRTGDFYQFNDVDDLARKIKQWTQRGEVDEVVRSACIARIGERYNANYQLSVIRQALGLPPIVAPQVTVKQSAMS